MFAAPHLAGNRNPEPIFHPDPTWHSAKYDLPAARVIAKVLRGRMRAGKTCSATRQATRDCWFHDGLWSARTADCSKLTKHSHAPVGLSFRGFFRLQCLIQNLQEEIQSTTSFCVMVRMGYRRASFQKRARHSPGLAPETAFRGPFILTRGELLARC